MFVLICILNRGGIHISRFGTHLGSGVTVPYDFGTTEKSKEIYYAPVLFIYFENTVVQITIFFHLDVNILIIKTNTIITLLYYVYNLSCFHCECTQIQADLYPGIINKTISV